MPKVNSTVRITTSLNRLSLGIANAVLDNPRFRRIIDDFALEEADYYQQNSPVGATGELIANWDIIPARRMSATLATMRFSILNTSEKATFRIAGRAPGKRPPIEPIEAWAFIVLGDIGAAWAVATNIGKFGTQRWRDQDNWVGIDNQGNPITGGRLDTINARLAEYVRRL